MTADFAGRTCATQFALDSFTMGSRLFRRRHGRPRTGGPRDDRETPGTPR